MTAIIKDVTLLRQKSEPVSSVQEAKDIVQKLEAILMQCDGFGLSAIQIGIAKNVAIIRKSKGGGFVNIINPEIIEQDSPYDFIGEGCLSFPGIFVKSKRFEHFTIKNQVIEDDKFREETQYYYSDSHHQQEKTDSDYESLACQHEIDHMLGKIIIDQWEQSGGTIIRKSDKIGRNDLCPCKSGKKFKKCCMGKKIYD